MSKLQAQAGASFFVHGVGGKLLLASRRVGADEVVEFFCFHTDVMVVLMDGLIYILYV